MSTGGNSPQPSTARAARRFEMKRLRNLSELELKNKRSQIWSQRAQVVVAAISMVAVLIAIWVAWQGQETVNHNSQTALRQSEDSQLSTAITSLGSGDTAERIAGLLLLTHNVSGRFKLSTEADEPPTDVYSDYATALQILSGYLRSHGEAFLASTSTGPMAQRFGLGYGILPPRTLGILPIDLSYAADQLRPLLNLETEVAALNTGKPAMDLSHDELYRQFWPDVNFGWIRAYMPYVNLRGAILTSSQWNRYPYLSGAYLQCADLEGANFGGANLTHADLRGANVQGANFRDAHIRKAQLAQIYGTAKWPSWRHAAAALPAKSWNQAACLRNSRFWDDPPTSVSAPLPSPRTSSSVTPKPSANKGEA